jgi:hypothetical protein
MHRVTPEIESLSKEILTYTMDRLKMDPPTLDHHGGVGGLILFDRE